MPVRSLVPLTLREQPRGASWGPEVMQKSGLEMLRDSIEQRLPDAPITRLTGLRLSEAGLGSASAWMPSSPWWQSGAGVFLAGALAFAADMPLGCAVLSGAPPGIGMTTSELSLNFLRAGTIRCQTIIGRGRLIHATKSLGLSEATIEDARGRLLAHATSRCVLFPLDPEVMAARQRLESQISSSPDPYLLPIEGDIYGQEYWDHTPGSEVMRQVVAQEFVPPCWLLMGVRGVDAAEGQITMALRTTGWLCNAFGVIYVGAIAFLVDAAIVNAAGSTVPAATSFNTMDIKVHFLRPVLPGDGELVARAKVVHRGRTIAVVDCEIRDQQDKLAAQASGSVLILPGRPWERRPVHVVNEITPETARILTTVLFVDVVDSTRKAAEVGDRNWRNLLTDFHSTVREQLQRFGGHEVDSAGDGFLVTFDGAARAIQCAVASRDRVRQIGLEVRCGIHAGEVEQSAGKLAGIAVHIGSRISTLASPGEILVSGLVKDLVAGTSIRFEDRGEHKLKGADGQWRLFSARL